MNKAPSSFRTDLIFENWSLQRQVTLPNVIITNSLRQPKGSLVYDLSTKRICYTDGVKWHPLCPTIQQGPPGPPGPPGPQGIPGSHALASDPLGSHALPSSVVLPQIVTSTSSSSLASLKHESRLSTRSKDSTPSKLSHCNTPREAFDTIPTAQVPVEHKETPTLGKIRTNELNDPTPVAFAVQKSVTQAITANTLSVIGEWVVANTAEYTDLGLDLTTGIFTASSNGKYHVSGKVGALYFIGHASAALLYVCVNGINVYEESFGLAHMSPSANISVDVALNVGDALTLQVINNDAVNPINIVCGPGTKFCVHKL
jgi:hypothetical protein